MRKYLLLLLLFPFLNHAAPLAGDYFINQNGSEDYSSITAAVADLNSEGISAPVTFKIRSGTYDEQVTITEIIRTGQGNDLVNFRPANLGDTIIWKNSAQDQLSNWVVKIEGAQFLKFKKITFEATNDDAQNLLYYLGDTDSITIVDCIFDGLVPATNVDLKTELILTDTVPHNDVNSTGYIFDGNTFNNGLRGIYANSNLDKFLIRNNNFDGQANAGVNLKTSSAMSSADNIIKNNVFNDAPWTFNSRPYMSIAIYSGAVTVKNNRVNVSYKGSFGIFCINGNSSSPTLIYNNFISITNPTGNTIAASIGKNTKFLHNTIRTEQATDIGIKAGSTVAQSTTINNNIVMSTGGGIALVLPLDELTSSIDELTDNNFYTTGGTLVTWGEVSPGVSRDFSSIGGFQSYIKATHPKVGFSNSILFAGNLSGDIDDLHFPTMIIGNSQLVAHPQIEVTDDIDGDVRTAINVYIGADQSQAIVLPLDNADAANGSFYTVGGSTPDYLTPQEALDDLYRRGTKAEVKFKIKAGSYGTNVYLKDIQKLNPNDLISIVGANPANKPVLSLLGSATVNHIITVEDTAYAQFKNLDFLMSGSGTGGLFLKNTTDSSVESSIFTNGGSGIDLYDFLYLPRTITISNNTLVDQQNYGISADNVGGINVSNNTISSSGTNYKAISFSGQLSTHLEISANTIDACTFSPDCYGIYVDHSSGMDGSEALISNNFIRARVGINLENSINYWNIYHNTLNTAGFGIITQAAAGQAPNNLRIFNNIILTTTNKTALSINFSSAFQANDILIDYNMYNTPSSVEFFQFYGNSYADTQNFSSNTSKDIHSLQKFNTFVDLANGDHHLAGSSIGDSDLAGVFVGINNDIDGESRSTLLPYIGADEAATPLSATRVHVSNSALTPDNLTNEDSMQVELLVKLLAQPTDDVAVAFASDNVNEGTIIAPAQLIFTSANWNQSQNMTIQGVDDFISDGNINYSVIYSVLSDDAEYDAIPVQVLDFTNSDNDLNSKIALELINHASEPATAATVKFKLLNDATAPNDVPLRDLQDITIDYTYIGNTASVIIDYTPLSGTVILPALSEFVEISINPVDDIFIEATEDLNITITNISGGIASVAIDNITNGLTVNIEDNETGVLTVSNPQNLTEPATNGEFELILTGGVSVTNTEISFYFTGSAVNNDDYNVSSSSVTLLAFHNSVTVPINIVDDIDSEEQEVIVVNLNTISNPLIALDSNPPPLIYVNDNDTDADIEVTISAINPAIAIGEAFDFTLTLINHDAINVHQAVLQVDEPAGLDFTIWLCLASSSYCSQTPGSGNLVDVVSIAANSQIQFAVSALVTGTLGDTINIQAILNPAPFLNDTDTNNNTADASSLIDVFFQNGFENSINNRMYEIISGYAKAEHYSYYFLNVEGDNYRFIEIDKQLESVRYRYVDIDIIKETISNSEWINGRF